MRSLLQQHRYDLLALVAVGLLAALLTWQRSGGVDPIIFDFRQEQVEDVWFDADLPKIALIMTDRSTDRHKIANRHPLISLTFNPLVAGLQRMRVEPVRAMRVWLAVVGAIWAAALFVLLRRMECQRVDAVVFTLLGLSSAAATFWLAVPEAFVVGSATVALGLCLLTVVPRKGRGWMADAGAHVLFFSQTITNGGFSVAWLLERRPVVDALKGLALAATALGGLIAVQFWLYPYSGARGYESLLEFTFIPTLDRVAKVAAMFFGGTMVLPPITFTHREVTGMTVQGGLPGGAGLAGLSAAVAWVALLALGLWHTWREFRQGRVLRQLILLSVCGQLLLHLVFGEETFLYSMHFVPLLVAVAAGAARTQHRVLALTLAVVVTAGSWVNNTQQLRVAEGFVAQLER